MNELINNFDNREIAVAVWLTLGFGLAIKNAKIRGSIGAVIRAFCVRQILTVFSLAIIYMAGIVFLLAAIGVWTFSQLKLTVLWFLTVGSLGFFSLPKISQDQNFLAESARGNFKATAVLEFFINLYRMPLIAELFFVPFAAALGALIAVSETSDEYPLVKKVLNGLAVIVGLLLLLYAGIKLAGDFDSIFQIDALRSFFLPILFSMLFLPFLWAAAVYISYQEVFIRLDIMVKEKTLHPYIKRSLLLKFKGNIRYLRVWFQTAWARDFSNKADVDSSIQSMLDGVCAIDRNKGGNSV